MPHVLLITVVIGSALNKIGNWGDRQLGQKTSKAVGRGLDKLGREVNTALKEVESERNQQIRKRFKRELVESQLYRQEKEKNTEQLNICLEDQKSLHSGLKSNARLEQTDHQLVKPIDYEKYKRPAINEVTKPNSIVKVKSKTNLKGHQKVFITRSNLASIVYNIAPAYPQRVDFQEVYKRSLSRILSHKELALLCVYKEVCENPESIYEIYKRIKKVDKQNKYVFGSSSRSYHKDPDCELLLGNYFNIEIPPEIQHKGEKTIERFREFCVTHKALLETDERHFLEKLEAHFLLINPPKTVNANNSGVEQFENADLVLVEKQIDELLFDAERYRESSPENKAIIDRLGYGSNKVKEASDPNNPLYTWHNKYKLPLKALVKCYFRVKFNEELSFDGHLLDQLEFSPCKKCVGNSIS